MICRLSSHRDVTAPGKDSGSGTPSDVKAATTAAAAAGSIATDQNGGKITGTTQLCQGHTQNSALSLSLKGLLAFG